MPPTFGNGKICYVEIPTIDINGQPSFTARYLAGTYERVTMAAYRSMMALAK